MIKKLSNLLLILVLFLGACAPAPVKFSQSDVQTIKNAPKVIAIHNGPIGPAFTTAMGAVAFQFSMGQAMGETGASIMQRLNMKDPIVQVQNEFMQAVMKKYDLHNLNVIKQPVPYAERDLDDLQKRFKTGYYLQFIPGQWHIIYYATDWSRYQMYYGAQARLIRLDDGKIFWTANCGANQDDKAHAPTREELEANNGALLKKWSQDSAHRCADQLIKDFLSQR